jgi:hypothetical protein
MHHLWSRAPAVSALVLAALVCGASAPSSAGAASGTALAGPASAPRVHTSPARPCGTRTYERAHPPRYRHVVVIMDENTRPRDLSRTDTPYLTWLRHHCGSQAHMHAATHASDPNYLAATSGLPTPAGSLNDAENLFRQVQDAGQRWRSYEQAMRVPCGSNVPRYTTYHDPAHWYRDLRSPVDTCRSNDLPMRPAIRHDLGSGRLPTFAWVTPDLCHDMHGSRECAAPPSRAIRTGDAWLGRFLPRVLRTPSYRRGRTVIFVTWDEGRGRAPKGVDCTSPAVYRVQASCRIPTFVLSPYIVPGARDTSDHNLYGLLATIQDILGYPRLARAVGQSSLRNGLGF